MIMLKFRENFFSCEELREIRKKFKYVEKDIHGNKRLFFDNAGGSLRLIRASDRFKEIDEIPDASEHTNKVALELLDIENQGRANMRMFFNAKRVYGFPVDDGGSQNYQWLCERNELCHNYFGTSVVI